MTRLREHHPWLSLIAKANPKKRQALIRTSGRKDIDIISECCFNMLKGNPKMTPAVKAKLKRHKSTIRYMAKPRTCWKKRKQRVLQNGGFLPLLLGPLISGISGIVSSLINRR